MLYCYNKRMATQLPSATLSDLIGMPSDRAVLIGAVREGLSYTLFEDLAEALELAHKDLATLLGIATRTLNTRKHTGRFTPQESDHLLRIARTYARALDFFGTPQQARAWLKRPAFAFGEETPLSRLDTELGAEGVVTLLGQLEHGVLP